MNRNNNGDDAIVIMKDPPGESFNKGVSMNQESVFLGTAKIPIFFFWTWERERKHEISSSY